MLDAFIPAKPYDFFTGSPQGSDRVNARNPAMQLPPVGPPTKPAAAPDPAEAPARKASQAFEATFLSEMLKYTGLNAMPDGFGGGAGEEAFSSLLTDQYARLLAERGGIGLAERVFDILKQRTRDA